MIVSNHMVERLELLLTIPILTEQTICIQADIDTDSTVKVSSTPRIDATSLAASLLLVLSSIVTANEPDLFFALIGSPKILSEVRNHVSHSALVTLTFCKTLCFFRATQPLQRVFTKSPSLRGSEATAMS